MKLNIKNYRNKNLLIKIANTRMFLLTVLVIFFILVRIPYLGFSNFNTDSFKWKQRIYDFGTGVFTLSFEKTNQKYHPGVTLMWIGAVSVKFHTLVNDYLSASPIPENSTQYIFSLNFYQIFFVVLSCGILIGLSYYFLSQILGNLKSFLILIIVSLEPFFMAMTTTLHLDGLLTLLILNSVLSFYLFLQNSQKKFAITSGVFIGLSLLTKTTALLTIPILVFLFFIYRKFSWNSLKTLFQQLLWVFLPIVVTYFVFWPAMWVAPIDTLTYVYKGVTVGTDDHSQIFFGNLTTDPGPLFYILVLIYKSSPFLIPALLVSIFLIYKNIKSRGYYFELSLLFFSLMFLIEISIPSKKLDRYLLPAMIILAISVLSILYDRYMKVLFLLFSVNLFTIFYIRYDFFSYYNPLLFDNKYAPFVLEPKWAYGQVELLDFFTNEMVVGNLKPLTSEEDEIALIDNSVVLERLIVAFPEKYYTQLHPYPRLVGGIGVINDLGGHARKASYFVFPVWENNSSEYLEKYNLEYYSSIRVRGQETYLVYKKKK